MKTNIQQLSEIEKLIYSFAYDDLTPYLQGIRDVINLLNGDEQMENELLIDTVKNNIKDIK